MKKLSYIVFSSLLIFGLLTPFISKAADWGKYQEIYKQFQQLQEQYGDTASGVATGYDLILREFQKKLIEYGIKIANELLAEKNKKNSVKSEDLIKDSGMTVENQKAQGGSSEVNARGNDENSGGGGGGAGGGMNNPFGGRVNSAYFCTATGNYWISLTPAKSDLPSDLIYNAGSARTYAFYQVTTPGNQILGTWNGEGECAEWDGPYRRTVKMANLIYMVGTSGGGGSSGPTQPPANTEPEDDDEDDDPPAQPTSTPSTPPSDKCNQETLAGWTFNPGIEDQVGDASASLKSLLYCVCNKMKQTNMTGKITSISDSHHIGNLGYCRNPATYTRCGSGSNCCYHSRTSCHYGGDKGDNKSYGADLGMSGAALTKKYVSQCGGSYIDEGNHIHVATSDCRGN